MESAEGGYDRVCIAAAGEDRTRVDESLFLSESATALGKKMAMFTTRHGFNGQNREKTKLSQPGFLYEHSSCTRPKKNNNIRARGISAKQVKKIPTHFRLASCSLMNTTSCCSRLVSGQSEHDPMDRRGNSIKPVSFTTPLLSYKWRLFS